MGTELVSALEKLAQLLTAKNEEGASSAGTIVQNTEVVHKLVLMPCDVKLDGVGNYLSWSRRVLLILKTKELEEYVLGGVDEPADKTSTDWKKWSVSNSLILAWMLNSLAPSIAASVETFSSASEVWSLLSKRYSGKGNLMLMSQIEDKVHGVRQGDMSVGTYVAELQHLWADLDQCDPLELPHAESMEIARAWVERRRVMQFLKGLNQCFEGRRASLLHQPKLSSLDEAIAAMSQEEVRLQFQKGSGSESAFRVTDQRQWEPARRDNRECFNCGVTGHLIRFCTAPRRGRGRGYNGSNGSSNRGRYSGNGGRGTQFGGEPHRAHMTTPSEGNAGSHENKPSESAPASMAHQEAASFGHFAHFVHNNEGETDGQETWDWNQA